MTLLNKNFFPYNRGGIDLLFYNHVLHRRKHQPKAVRGWYINRRINSQENWIKNIFVSKVCEIVRTYDDYFADPSLVFRILYDSNKLVIFTHEVFFHYDLKLDFDWQEIVDLIYLAHARDLAKKITIMQQI